MECVVKVSMNVPEFYVRAGGARPAVPAVLTSGNLSGIKQARGAIERRGGFGGWKTNSLSWLHRYMQFHIMKNFSLKII